MGLEYPYSWNQRAYDIQLITRHAGISRTDVISHLMKVRKMLLLRSLRRCYVINAWWSGDNSALTGHRLELVSASSWQSISPPIPLCVYSFRMWGRKKALRKMRWISSCTNRKCLSKLQCPMHSLWKQRQPTVRYPQMEQ